MTKTDKIMAIVGLHSAKPAMTDDLEKDLGLDSLDKLEIQLYLEEAFDIHIEDEEADKCKTVKDVVELVLSKDSDK